MFFLRQVYHLECLRECFSGEGFDDADSLGTFICPWHQCWTCCKRVASAGGLLFRCAECPTAYCFDCLPDDRTPADATPQQLAEFAKYASSARLVAVCLTFMLSNLHNRVYHVCDFYSPAVAVKLFIPCFAPQFAPRFASVVSIATL